MADAEPTIEWVAEQLGEPHAHLAPYQTNVGTFPDEMQRSVWWAVFGWSEDIARRVTSRPIMWTDEDGNDQARWLARPVTMRCSRLPRRCKRVASDSPSRSPSAGTSARRCT